MVEVLLLRPAWRRALAGAGTPGTPGATVAPGSTRDRWCSRWTLAHRRGDGAAVVGGSVEEAVAPWARCRCPPTSTGSWWIPSDIRPSTPAGGLGGGTDRRAALHRGAACRPGGARHRGDGGRSRDRPRHLPPHRRRAHQRSCDAPRARHRGGGRRGRRRRSPGPRRAGGGGGHHRGQIARGGRRRRCASRLRWMPPTSSSLRAISFRVVDLLLTNFHVPGSTLIVLVAAFMGPDWRQAYADGAGARLPVPLVRGRHAGGAGTMSALAVHHRHHRWRGARRDAARRPTGGRHPGIHAGGDPGHGAGGRGRRPRRSGGDHGARQHLPPDAAARRRGDRRPGRGAALHGVGRTGAHRFRRLPGVLPRSRGSTRTG